MNKRNNRTTYIFCDSNMATGYCIGWIIAAGINITLFLMGAIFSPLLIFPLHKLNNRNDGTPDRPIGETFAAHPVQRFFSIASLVSFTVLAVGFYLESRITGFWELSKSFYIDNPLYKIVDPIYVGAFFTSLGIGVILVFMLLAAMHDD